MRHVHLYLFAIKDVGFGKAQAGFGIIDISVNGAYGEVRKLLTDWLEPGMRSDVACMPKLMCCR